MWKGGMLRAQLDRYVEDCAPTILPRTCCCQQHATNMELKVPVRSQRWYLDSHINCEPETTPHEDQLLSRSSYATPTSRRRGSSCNTSDRPPLRTMNEGCGASSVVCLEAPERGRPTCDELHKLVNKNNDCFAATTNMCLGGRGLDALWRLMPGQPKQIEADPATGSRPTYHVALVTGHGNARKKLGFDIEMAEDRAVLTVLKIHGGLAGRWNQHNPDNQIHEGDCIIEVNGIWGNGARMVEECRTASLIEMTLISLVTESQASTRGSPQRTRTSLATRVDRDVYYGGLP